MIKKFAIAAAAAATALTALPAAAQAQYHDGYRDGGRYEQSYRGDRNRRGYQQQRHYDTRGYDNRYYGRTNRYDNNRGCSGTTGTIVGGAAGALLGRSLDRGYNRTTGTIAGGLVGALLGREVGKSGCRR